MRKLNENQTKFVHEYLKDLNGAAAVRRSGYKSKNPHLIAQFLLGKKHIQDALERTRQELASRLSMDSERVLAELSLVASSDIGDIIDFTNGVLKLREPHDIPAHARKAISSVKIKRVLEKTPEGIQPTEIIEFKLWPKIEALKTLAQVHGLLKNGKDDDPERTQLIDRVFSFLREFRDLAERRRAGISGTDHPALGPASPVVDAGPVV